MTAPKILIVDDDPGIISKIVEILEKEKYILFVANNGEVAFKIACDEIPDLILLDWQMPLLNGLETISKLKENETTRQILIIMVTGIMTDTDNLLKAYEMGVVDFVRKPFNALELLARTRAVLKLAEFYREQIERKNKELIISALKAVEFNQLISEIIIIITESEVKLKISDNELYNEFNKLKSKINNRFHAKIWQQFEEQFIHIIPGFYKQLLQKYENLTAAELKLCSLLRLNLDTKQIATILCQEYDSIKVSRSRLRKKLNLPQEINLSAFLMQF